MEIVREVEKIIEVPVEVIKLVEVERIKEVPVERKIIEIVEKRVIFKFINFIVEFIFSICLFPKIEFASITVSKYIF